MKDILEKIDAIIEKTISISDVKKVCKELGVVYSGKHGNTGKFIIKVSKDKYDELPKMKKHKKVKGIIGMPGMGFDYNSQSYTMLLDLK